MKQYEYYCINRYQLQRKYDCQFKRFYAPKSIMWAPLLRFAYNFYLSEYMYFKMTKSQIF